MPSPAIIPAVAATAKAAAAIRPWQNGTDKASVQTQRLKTAGEIVGAIASVVEHYVDQSGRVQQTHLECERERARFEAIDDVNARCHEARLLTIARLQSEDAMVAALCSLERAERGAYEALKPR